MVMSSRWVTVAVVCSRTRWDVWSGDREKVRAPFSKPTSNTGKVPLDSVTSTSPNATVTSRGSWRWWRRTPTLYSSRADLSSHCETCPLVCPLRILSMTPAVVLPWPKWPSGTHTASRRGRNSSSLLRASTLDSSSTVARRVRRSKLTFKDNADEQDALPVVIVGVDVEMQIKWSKMV